MKKLFKMMSDKNKIEKILKKNNLYYKHENSNKDFDELKMHDTCGPEYVCFMFDKSGVFKSICREIIF